MSWGCSMDDKQRSIQQNKYLFGPAYGALLAALPKKPSLQDKEAWHEYWCMDFFGSLTIGFPGSERKLNKPRRTTTRNEAGERDVISTKVFNDFVLNLQAECMQNGIDIPGPNEPPLSEYDTQ